MALSLTWWLWWGKSFAGKVWANHPLLYTYFQPSTTKTAQKWQRPKLDCQGRHHFRLGAATLESPLTAVCPQNGIKLYHRPLRGNKWGFCRRWIPYREFGNQFAQLGWSLCFTGTAGRLGMLPASPSQHREKATTEVLHACDSEILPGIA